ncbi:exo-alpha-sialidase [Microbacterium sp. KSW2-21]|uniref:exo-alpha-sialidase n=1 Tax=Microbacterium algihabitans TaxID=3075992 RepID=A0ABU3RV83_9MICO|nr:exo-alpha-sialidase [Microbacterium sp. KSW2-21]MDU0326495.1 exo-alpha-sialidase [Microbacterium sp. KSW2-21]
MKPAFVPHPRMRRAVCVGVTIGALLAAAFVTPAQAASGNSTDPTSAPGSYAAQNLAADRTSANFFYRIPALTHLGDGVVLAAWDARPGSAADAPNPNSIVQRRSTDNGATWGPQTVVAAGKAADASGPKFGYSDPSYVTDRSTGRVFAFFVYSKDVSFQSSGYGNLDSDRNILSSAVAHSDDGGLTWSAPRLITSVTKPAVGGASAPVAGDVKGTFATSGEGIQLRYGPHAGRLIQQFAGIVLQANGSTAIQAYSVYSDDHGATWTKGANVGTGMDENKVVELADGRVMLNSRDSANGRLRKTAISTDGGATYGAVTSDAELPDPTNNASIIRLHPDAPSGSADARKLVFTNANNGANGDRVNGAVRVSCDDGQTWPGLRSITTGFFAYSSATTLDDGRIGVLWEKSYTNDMQLSTFDEAWLNYACAPLSAPAQTIQPGQTVQVPVTVTNQEAAALTGTVTLAPPSGWTAGSTAVSALAAGASRTVSVTLTAASAASGTQNVAAVFTANDGRTSQATVSVTAPAGALSATITGARADGSRNLTTTPYRVGEQVPYTFRVQNTSSTTITVTPTSGDFSPFLPPGTGNCRWTNLAANGAYTCSTPRHTVTQADLDRGYFVADTVWSLSASGATTRSISVTGGQVAVR